jgi:hypothetical protein
VAAKADDAILKEVGFELEPAVLRRGMANDFSSAIDMAEELIAVVSAEEIPLQGPPTAFPPVAAAPSGTAATERTRSKPATGGARGCRLMFIVGLLVLAGILLFVGYRSIDPITPQNTAVKAIRLEHPAGALLRKLGGPQREWKRGHRTGVKT